LRSPPPPAHVRELTEELVEPSPEIREFRVIYGDYAEELQEGFGAMQAIFTDYWREFRDYRKEFEDYRQEFKDYRKEFREFADRTDENFRILFERYGEISEKLTVILETLVRESKETREQLAKAMDRLAAAIEALKGPSSPEKN